jgi:hypothetical protein
VSKRTSAKLKKNKEEKTKNPGFKQANVVELGYRPPHARILWVGISEKDGKRNIHSGATYEGLMKARNKVEMTEFMVVDLKKQVVIPITDVGGFMMNWRENYFNSKWGFKQIKEFSAS